MARDGDERNRVQGSRRIDRSRCASRSAEGAAQLVMSCVSDVEACSVDWLWGELVARGMVTSLTGSSGVGKTFVALDVAAAVTRGDRKTLRRSKGEPATPSFLGDAGDVLLISTGNELRHVIRPRLAAAGAVMSRVHVLNGIRSHDGDSGVDSNRPFELNVDLTLLEQEIERRQGTGSPLRLIVIDPWERIDDRVDAAEFRVGRTGTGTADGTSPRSSFHATLRRLVRMGAAAKVAILVVVNCPGTPRANLTHQIQILESTVQSAWWIGGDPYRPERRLMLPVKMNLLEKSPGRSFVINDGHVQWDSRPIWLNAERFQRETREHLARPLMEQDFTELARAMHWLAEHMGTNVHRYQDVKLAADFVGFRERTLRRAFCGLKGVSWRIPDTNSWAWKLREGDVVNPHLPWIVDQFLYEDDEEIVSDEIVAS